MKFRITLFLLLVVSAAVADDDGYVDFTDQMTPVCEVVGLAVKPPAGWINVPLDSDDEAIAGCQMMLIEDEALIGMLRLLSVELKDDVDAHKILVGIEAQVLVEMNYLLGERLWSRENVPVAGVEGYGGGTALAVALSIPGNVNHRKAISSPFTAPTPTT